jgi:hypothetical protein
MSHSWNKLDRIMRQYSPMLRDELGLTPPASNELASTIAAEVRSLPPDALRSIRDDDTVGLQRRLDELVSFERFMDLATQILASSGPCPPLARAQVSYQLYTVFVYLGDACFSRLRKLAASGSVLKKCSRYLTDYPIRGLRNAVAHSNWHYADDFSELRFITSAMTRRPLPLTTPSSNWSWTSGTSLQGLQLMPPFRLSTIWPNQSMERTAARSASTFCVAKTSLLRTMCALGGGRSSLSR